MGRVSGSAVALPPGSNTSSSTFQFTIPSSDPGSSSVNASRASGWSIAHGERAGGHALATRRPATVHRALTVTLEWTLGDARLADDEALHVDLDISCERARS